MIIMARLLSQTTEEKMTRNYPVPQMFAQRSIHVAQANIHFCAGAFKEGVNLMERDCCNESFQKCLAYTWTYPFLLGPLHHESIPL